MLITTFDSTILSSTSRSRRKATLVPNTAESMFIEFEDSFVAPERPSVNLVMMQRLAMFRAIAKTLFVEMNIPQMDFKDNDLISFYKFCR